MIIQGYPYLDTNLSFDQVKNNLFWLYPNLLIKDISLDNLKNILDSDYFLYRDSEIDEWIHKVVKFHYLDKLVNHEQ